MTLTPGSRLGPYEITEQIGIGGMGEVYRARDVNLGRDVAIKVLPEAFARDADRLARFEREAKTLASLSHPNIAIVHGFEKTGDVRALVMELVEGPTLADRIAQGPLAIDEALPIARQIAEALEAAHEQGIVHRDLKPANVKVRDDGTVKVLDFGLAKMLEGPAEAGRYVGDGRSVRLQPDLSRSPTITTPAMTQIGVILGTAAYMAPEQARGKPVDKRSDIWAFGCVLFEMLVGTRAFEGEDATDTIAAVVRAEPKWDALPADVPSHIRLLLQRCLEKDRKKRIGDISTALFIMREEAGALVTGSIPTANTVPRSLWHRTRVPVAAVVVTAVVVGGAVWWLSRPTPLAVVRTIISTSSAPLRPTGIDPDMTITPDGSRIVYRGEKGLLVRALDQLEPKALTGVGTPRGPFVSPDGNSIGYFEATRSTLNKVSIAGGPPLSITEGSLGGAFRGATWGPDGTIVYADAGPRNGLFRVSSDGGASTVLTKPDQSRGEGDHVWPEFLPGGHAILFTITPNSRTLENAQIAVLDLRTQHYKVLIRGGMNPHYVPTGHLVYSVPGTLRAIPFDAERLEVTGTEAPILDGVATTGAGAAQVAIASNGTMVYVPGRGNASAERALVWVDRSGKEEPIAGAPLREYQFPRISPDGTRVALDLRDQEQDIEIWDFARKTMTRLTFDPGADQYPVWAGNNRIIFASSRDGAVGGNLYSQSADGTGTVEKIVDSKNPQQPQSFAPDGSGLIIREGRGDKFGFDLFFVPLHPPAVARPLVTTRAVEVSAELSPNGRWLAYQSSDSGPADVFVRPFPNTDAGLSQVSRGGGRMPLWSRDGTELFFVAADNTLMRVRVEGGDSFRFTSPEKVLNAGYFIPGGTNSRTFDISPDSRRFLMIKPVGPTASDGGGSANLVVVQNWFEELKRLVPAK